MNTVSPTPAPSPEITAVVVEPEALSEGDTATIKISVTNNGGPSSNGFIAVSFPDNEEIIDVSGTGSDYNKLFSIGDSIVTSTGSSIAAVNPLVELHDLDWDSDQTETLTIKVKTNEGASELRCYARATLRAQDVANYVRTPDSSPITDQQGFYVKEYSFDVLANQAPTANIVSISPNPVTEGTTVFFSGEGDDTDGTISNWKWESSIDGNLSSSESFSTSDLSVGAHTIYFSVSDDDNEWSEEVSRTLTINEIPVQNGNDSVAPFLVNVTPADGSTLDPDTSSVQIRFNYEDEQSNISSSSVVFIFDNVDVTADANTTIADSYALYNASGLSAGSHSASVYVVDNAGNAVMFSTDFTISEASSSTSSSSSGGGGGGGGGSTGESYSNIADKEVDSFFVTTDAHVIYGFSNVGNPITTVEFDSKKTAGTIQATVEVLKDTSALVDEDAPGEIYQRMNIWVGKVGYATDNNVENMIVTFRVEKSWLEDNNVPAESVSLYRYSDDVWASLSTEISREDDEYVYFDSQTPGFSPFSISGEAKESLMSVTDEIADNEVVEQVDVQDEDAEETSSGVSAAGLVMILILLSAILIGGYAMTQKKG
ncbi:MAG: PGF-pre-PGF domain-containing protein [Methanolobus sp.]